jgi:g-D-glutamyl-meso-diaminopimelate peptidase
MHITLGHGEKKLLFLGAHHGREYITAAFLMKMAEEYAICYKNNLKAESYDVRRLLDEVSLDMVPMVNPDGVIICQKGLRSMAQSKRISGMRLLGEDYSEWKANANGVDLNRQYPCLWEQLRTGVDVPASQGYKGQSPAQEPEVKAVMRLCMDNAYALAVSFHTKGEEIYYADSLTGELPGAYGIAQHLSAFSGYAIKEPSSEPGTYAGGFENWFRMLFHRCALLIEMTPYDDTGHPHDDKDFCQLTRWKKTCLMGLMLAEAVRQV